jgi:purine-binding chemotaxis protein CheW
VEPKVDSGAGEPLAARPVASGPVRYVLFRVAGEVFALPLDAIREVVTPQPPFARVPRCSEAVRGAMNLRGRVVAVVDLAPMVGLPPQPLMGSLGQVVILDRDKRALGFLIGGVLRVDRFEPPRRVEGARSVQGVATTGAGAATVLDADGLMAEAAALFGGG